MLLADSRVNPSETGPAVNRSDREEEEGNMSDLLHV